MSDEQLNEINNKLNQIVNQRSRNASSMLNFLFSAGMPVIIAVIGIVFTFMNNRRQIEFQQIQVADKMIADVQDDLDFTKQKLDLKLLFVESMFQDPKFKTRVKDLLSQTYAVSLESQASDLAVLAQSDNAEDVKYVQNKIAEAKKFGDTSINNVVKQLEQKPSIRNITKPGSVKDTSQTKTSTKDSIGIKKPLKPVSHDSVKTTSPKKTGNSKNQKDDNKNTKKKKGE